MKSALNSAKKLLLILSLLCAGAVGAAVPHLDAHLDHAYARVNSNELCVGTGQIERRWRITDHGLTTIGLKDLVSGHEWAATNSEDSCDWAFDGLEKIDLVGIAAKSDDDEHFTASHLEVRAEFREGQKQLTYVVWAYPDAAGLRTQIKLADAGAGDRGLVFTNDQTDAIDFDQSFRGITAFGYKQGSRSTDVKPLLREEELPWRDTAVNWANGVILSGDAGGVVFVKESNKHTAMKPDQLRLTGSFLVASNQVRLTGAGFAPQAVTAQPLGCWANWTLLYRGDAAAAQLAIKEFDRKRYPVDAKHDLFIMANTWGSEDMPDECRHAAREENVMAELRSCADLGVDVVQIDDGWQNADWLPAASAAQVKPLGGLVKKYGDYPVYPEGFKNVRQLAAELGMKLGLWSAWTIPLERLEQNYNTGGFNYFKLDFARLPDKPAVDALLAKARALVAHTGHTARVNWDVTEVVPRMGFYYGREVGNMYLANRKTFTQRKDVQYYPYEMLRGAWLVAKYGNLNKYQVSIVNLDHVPPGSHLPQITDYPQTYAVALALMSSPMFFQETHLYTPAARAEVKTVIRPYRKRREEMNAGYVFPIGDLPDDVSWTGFCDYLPGASAGYLLVFRERLNGEATHRFTLPLLRNKTLQLTDLITGKSFSASVDAQGGLTMTINQPADFRYYRYEIP